MEVEGMVPVVVDESFKFKNEKREVTNLLQSLHFPPPTSSSCCAVRRSTPLHILSLSPEDCSFFLSKTPPNLIL